VGRSGGRKASRKDLQRGGTKKTWKWASGEGVCVFLNLCGGFGSRGTEKRKKCERGPGREPGEKKT